MKNYFIGLCGLVLLAVSSCRKVDDSSVFGQSPDQRINETLAKYQAQLSGATAVFSRAGLIGAMAQKP